MKPKVFELMLLCGLILCFTACGSQPRPANSTDSNDSNGELSTAQPESQNQQEEDDADGPYKGCLAGLVETDQGADFVALDPESKEVEKITTMDDVWPGMSTALSSDGKKLAYANYIASNPENARIGESMELFVLDLETNTETTVLNNPVGQQIESIRWLPDNKTIIFSLCVPEESYLDYFLYAYDIETKEMKCLDQGTTESDLSPEKIAEQEEKYQKKIPVPYEIDDTFMFTTVQYPAISPDGTKVLYTTSFHRRMTPGYDQDTPDDQRPQLWLLSGLWSMNADGTGTPELLYTNPDWRPNTGKAIWSQDGTEIYFSRYKDSINSQNSDIEKLDLETKETEVLLQPTEEMYTNRVCAALPEHRLIFCADGENGLQNYIMDTETGDFEPYSCVYQGKPFNLQTFRMVS